MHKVIAWLKETPYAAWEVTVASEDASFRRYFRLQRDGETCIVMDASLETATLAPFLDVTERLCKVGVRVPKVYAEDRTQGFLVLEDFGSQPLQGALDGSNFKMLYRQCMEEIVKMQCANVDGLPLYDKAFLHFEMNLMQQWFLQRYLGWTLSPNDHSVLSNVFNSISEIVLQQPQGVFVHRDYHSRNIMLTPGGKAGVIDYQDAMNGAVTYDLVSLLKDLYIRFDTEDIEALALEFRDMAGLDVDDSTFLKWFDFMGMQRHIKVLGIFSRLYLRDNKSGYLKDLPLTLRYTIEAAERYEETKPLAKLLKRVELP